MRFLRSSYYLFWLLLFGLSLTACQPRTDKPLHQLMTVKERGTLRVGTLFGATTYAQDENGETGLEFDLAQQFANYLDIDIVMVPSHHIDDLFSKLSRNEVDFLAAGLTATPNRQRQFRFAPTYYQVSPKVVFKKGNPWPRKIEQLKGEIVVLANSAHQELLIEKQASHPELKWRESATDNSESLLLKVLSGEIDYTVVDSTLLDSFRRYHPEVSIAFSLEKEQDISWMFAKSDDDSLYSLAIEFFSTLRENNKLAEMERHYFSHIDEFDYVDTRAFIRAAEHKLPRFKKLFQKNGHAIDWKLLAAISYQESHWNPQATSYTGVRGMMMLTQATAEQLKISDRLDPAQSIAGGARYVEKMLQRIPDKVPAGERMWFALAAYNVGFGHVMDAMAIAEKRGGNRYSWLDVKNALPLLRKRAWYKQTRFGYARGDEPVRYVTNIRRYYETLSWLEREAERERELAAQKNRFSNINEIMKKESEEKAAEQISEPEAIPTTIIALPNGNDKQEKPQSTSGKAKETQKDEIEPQPEQKTEENPAPDT